MHMWYPYDWKGSPLYEITFLIQWLMGLRATLFYSSLDIMFPCLSTLIVGQFKIIRMYQEYLYYLSVME